MGVNVNYLHYSLRASALYTSLSKLGTWTLPRWLASAATTRLVFSLLFHTLHQPPSFPLSQTVQLLVGLTISRPNVRLSIIRTKRTSMGRRACQFTRQQPSRAWVANTTILAPAILLAVTLVRQDSQPSTSFLSAAHANIHSLHRRTPSRKNILCSTCLHCVFRNGRP